MKNQNEANNLMGNLLNDKKCIDIIDGIVGSEEEVLNCLNEIKAFYANPE
jgi:hypothetical protein